MRTIRFILWITFCMATIGLPAARAQQQEQQQEPQQQPAPQRPEQSTPPIPAYHSPLAGAADNEEEEGAYANPQKLVPDNRSLAGAQNFTLGAPALSHSYWQPSFTFISTGDSNGLSATGTTGWTTWSSFFGGVNLHHISGDSDLTLAYFGGDSVSNDGSASNGIVQELQLGEKIMLRRATISILDELSYLPEIAFGFQGLPGTVLPGTGTIGLQPGLPPGQSILTTRGQRLSNTLVPEMDVLLTPRSTLTMLATYSLLNYFDNGLLNFYSAGVQAGYNYQWTRRDTVALLYNFNAYRYSNFNQSINDHVVHVSYGRRVTGKLAFQIAAGPEITSFQTPITTGAGTTSGSALSSAGTNLYWSLSTSLTYQMRRTGLSAAYNHGVTGGSGVQAGSIADTVSGTVTSPFSRTFSARWTLGYARNKGVTVVGLTTAPTNQVFGYWFTDVGLNHPMGRTMNLAFDYTLQYQDSNSSFCIGPACGSSFVRHQLSLTFGWHEHPYVF